MPLSVSFCVSSRYLARQPAARTVQSSIPLRDAPRFSRIFLDSSRSKNSGPSEFTNAPEYTSAASSISFFVSQSELMIISLGENLAISSFKCTSVAPTVTDVNFISPVVMSDAAKP